MEDPLPDIPSQLTDVCGARSENLETQEELASTPGIKDPGLWSSSASHPRVRMHLKNHTAEQTLMGRPLTAVRGTSGRALEQMSLVWHCALERTGSAVR